MPPKGGIYALRKVQIGKETTSGTSVPATEILLATAQVKPAYPIHRNPHPFGVLIEKAGPKTIVSKDVDIALSMEGVTYEQLAWLLAIGLDVPVTAGAGPYTHTFDPGIAALWAPHAATIEGRWTDGATPEDIEVEYCMARKLTISGEENGVVKAEADIFGRQITTATITALTAPTGLEQMRVADMKFYTNSTWALADVDGPAAGLWSNNVISFSLELDFGLMPFHGISGALTFSEHKEVVKAAKLTVQAIYDTGATESLKAERALAAAGTARFLTLYFVGSSGRKVRIVLTLAHENGDFLDITERNGLEVASMSLVSEHDATGAKLAKVVVTNNEAAAL